MTEILNRPPKVRKEARDKFSITALKKNQPSLHVDLRLTGYRTVSQYIFVA